MKRLILVVMLMAGCGGSEQPTVTDFAVILSDGRSGSLHAVIGGDNPSENASGELTLGSESMPFRLGRIGNTDGLLTVNATDGIRYFVLVFGVNRDGSLSGFICAHTRGEMLPPLIADCPTFSATH